MKPRKVKVDDYGGDLGRALTPEELRAKGLKNSIGPELLRVSVSWEGQQIEQDLNSDVAYDNNPEDLSRAITEQTSRFAWWAMLQVRAKYRLAGLERDLKVKRAEVLIQSKIKAASATVDILKAMVDVDPEVEVLERAVIEAEHEVQATQVGREALKDRKDALSMNSAMMRQEMEQGLRVLTPEARRRADDYRKRRGPSAQVAPE